MKHVKCIVNPVGAGFYHWYSEKGLCDIECVMMCQWVVISRVVPPSPEQICARYIGVHKYIFIVYYI